ncbi:MAG: hypothetical protein M3O46_09395 [Myxococcota bacterium]|nr:hypothetical protein [Myxococcota bacterium]
MRTVSSLLIAAFRLVLLLLAAAAVFLAFDLASRHDRNTSLSTGAYACPMHPEIAATAPGSCPLCGMALTPIPAGSSWLPVPAPGEMSVVRRRLVTEEVVAPAWIVDQRCVEALVYNEDLAALTPDERGSFVSGPSGGKGGVGRTVVTRAAARPSPWDASTSQVRFLVDGNTPPLHPGDVGRLVLLPKTHEVLVVPASAVLRAPEGSFVLAAMADAPTFQRRPVAVGKVLGGFAVVLSGLRDEERIVARDTFFLDAERLNGPSGRGVDAGRYGVTNISPSAPLRK